MKPTSKTNNKFRIFYINHGKFYISLVENDYRVRQAITKLHATFKQDCQWFTFEQAQKIIKRNRTLFETWGIVDVSGQQYVCGKFDGILTRK